MKLRKIFLVTPIFALVALSACSGMNESSTSREKKFSFSSDTRAYEDTLEGTSRQIFLSNDRDLYVYADGAPYNQKIAEKSSFYEISSRYLALASLCRGRTSVEWRGFVQFSPVQSDKYCFKSNGEVGPVEKAILNRSTNSVQGYTSENIRHYSGDSRKYFYVGEKQKEQTKCKYRLGAYNIVSEESGKTYSFDTDCAITELEWAGNDLYARAITKNNRRSEFFYIDTSSEKSIRKSIAQGPSKKSRHYNKYELSPAMVLEDRGYPAHLVNDKNIADTFYGDSSENILAYSMKKDQCSYTVYQFPIRTDNMKALKNQIPGTFEAAHYYEEPEDSDGGLYDECEAYFGRSVGEIILAHGDETSDKGIEYKIITIQGKKVTDLPYPFSAAG